MGILKKANPLLGVADALIEQQGGVEGIIEKSGIADFANSPVVETIKEGITNFKDSPVMGILKKANPLISVADVLIDQQGGVEGLLEKSGLLDIENSPAIKALQEANPLTAISDVLIDQQSIFEGILGNRDLAISSAASNFEKENPLKKSAFTILDEVDGIVESTNELGSSLKTIGMEPRGSILDNVDIAGPENISNPIVDAISTNLSPIVKLLEQLVTINSSGSANPATKGMPQTTAPAPIKNRSRARDMGSSDDPTEMKIDNYQFGFV